MIRSVTDGLDFAAELLKMSDGDPFACRILSLFHSYHPGLAFVDYWLTADDDGTTNGAIARNGSNFILFLTEQSALDEIASFLRLSGATGILCDGKYRLDFSAGDTTGVIMKINTPIDVADEDITLVAPDIKSAYELISLCADENFTPPAFEDFYVDVNHKLRHGAMRMYGIIDEGTLAALALTVAESGDGAVLGAVACHPDYRRKGFGSLIVQHTVNRLIAEQKTVFLHRAENANAAFYHKLGFIDCGIWREYKV